MFQTKNNITYLLPTPNFQMQTFVLVLVGCFVSVRAVALEKLLPTGCDLGQILPSASSAEQEEKHPFRCSGKKKNTTSSLTTQFYTNTKCWYDPLPVQELGKGQENPQTVHLISLEEA